MKLALLFDFKSSKIHETFLTMISLYIPNPLGFCAGVSNAIGASEKLFSYLKERPIYFYHNIVHNNYITSDLEKKGAIFTDDLSIVPDNSYVVFSAHGVSKKIEEIACEKNLKIIDLTCPLVHKVHKEIEHYSSDGYKIIYIGSKNHQESKGTLGRLLSEDKFFIVENESDVNNIPFSSNERVAYVSQTTLNVDKVQKLVDKIKEVLPNVVGSNIDDICHATKNRQGALKHVISQYKIDLVLVIGSSISSNSNKLVEVGADFFSFEEPMQNKKRKSFLIDSFEDIKDEWIDGVENIVLTAGASAPSILIDQTIDYLVKKFDVVVQRVSYIEERVKFYPPKLFRDLEKEYISAS